MVSSLVHSTLAGPLLAACLAGLIAHLALAPTTALAKRLGCVSRPRADRWSQREVPLLGGMAIAVGFWAAAVLFMGEPVLGILALGVGMFVLGGVDDMAPLSTAIKLEAQLAMACLFVASGTVLETGVGLWLDAPLTVFWLIGLTNALNLLDNMDGLAGGVALVAAVAMAFGFGLAGLMAHAALSGALAGALLAFLGANRHPASIFMGDAGSLFLGATLAALTVAFQNNAAQTLAGPLALAPLLVLLVPIADTVLVSLTRLMERRPLDQGGRDHMSHRLVKMGLSEPRAVGLLCGAELLCGAAALGVVWVSAPVGSAIAIGLGLLAVVGIGALARVEVGAGGAS